MLLTTQGIVLGNVKYNDKYSIAQVYTEEVGRVAYMVPRTKGRNVKVPPALFAPLNMVELVADHQPRREIQRLREARCVTAYHSIPADLRKTSMVFFLSDFLSRVLRDPGDSGRIFRFVADSMRVLEIAERGVANFHLVFMLRLTGLLGFYPNMEGYVAGDCFDLLAGEFVSVPPMHRHCVPKEACGAAAKLPRMNYANMHRFAYGRQARQEIVGYMLDYYRLHVQHFGELKSLEVLHELF